MGKHSNSNVCEYSSDEEQEYTTVQHYISNIDDKTIFARERMFLHCKNNGLPLCEFLTDTALKNYMTF